MFQKIKKHKTTCLFVCLLMMVFYACRKDFSTKDTYVKSAIEGQMDIALAQKYYKQMEKVQGNEVNDLVLLDKVSAIGQSFKSSSSAIKNRKYPLFNKAYESQTLRSTFVEVPIYYNQRFSLVMTSDKSKSISDQQEIFKYSFDRLVIYKDKRTGQISTRLVTYIPDIEYLKRHKYKISRNQIDRLDEDFTGYLEYKQWNGKRLYLLQYENGRKIRYMPFITARQRPQTLASKVKAGSITTMTMICNLTEIAIWGESCIGAGPESDTDQLCTPAIVGYDYIDICYDDGLSGDPCADYGDCNTGDPCIDYRDCDSSGGGDSGGGSGGGDGGGTGGSSTGDIRNSTTDPCISSVVNTALNAKNIEGKMSEIIQNFDQNKSVKIKIYDGSTQNGKPGDVSPFWTGNVFNVNITLQTSYFQNSTKEFCAATLVHEVVHAYLSYGSGVTNKLGSTSHDDMANKFITPMAEFLQNSYGISAMDATALAWAGIADANAYEHATEFTYDYDVITDQPLKMSKSDVEQISSSYATYDNDPVMVNVNKGTPICN